MLFLDELTESLTKKYGPELENHPASTVQMYNSQNLTVIDKDLNLGTQVDSSASGSSSSAAGAVATK